MIHSSVRPVKRQKVKRNSRPKTYLDNLAPEYLLHIYQYLQPLDIANASESSKYLAKFAETNIYKKHANCHIFDVLYAYYEHRKYTLAELRCVLRHFGKHIKRMTIKSHNFENPSTAHVTMIMRKCPNLDELIISNFYFNTPAVHMLKKVKCPARHLTLRCEGVTHRWREVFEMWQNVTQLTLYKFCDDTILSMLSGDHAIEWLTLINVCIMDSDFFFKLQNGQRRWLEKLSMIDMWSFNSHPTMYNQLPLLEQLQISVRGSTIIEGLHETRLKYLQLLYALEIFSKKPTILKWSLKDLPMLEELDLVGIPGDVCRVAANVPTLRVLSIQQANICADDGLVETVAKLPVLQRLRLRRCAFAPEELVQLVETNTSLTTIDIELPKIDSLTKMLESLIQNWDNKQPLSTTPRSSLQVRIIVESKDVSVSKKNE